MTLFTRYRSVGLLIVAIATLLTWPRVYERIAAERCMNAGKQWAYGACHEIAEVEFLTLGPSQNWGRAHVWAAVVSLLVTSLVVASFVIRDYTRAGKKTDASTM